MATRGKRIATALKMLGGCKRGTPVKSLLKVVKMCILPTMTFAAQAWGRLKNTAVLPLERALRAALRAALSVYCTTSISYLHHVIEISTVKIYLEHLQRLHAIRLHRLDLKHSLRERCTKAHLHHKSRLTQILKILSEEMKTVNSLRFSS